MSILSIERDWSGIPCIVRIESTDNLATISAAGYLSAQLLNIESANNGPFSWLPTDLVLITYINVLGLPQFAFFTISADLSSLIAATPGISPMIATTLTQAQVQAAYATPQLLIPAPGAGNVIKITAAQIVTQVSTAFAGGGVGHVQYGNTVHGGGANALDSTTPAAEITAASSQVYTQYGLPTTTVSTAITNLGVYFSNATGAFTGGAGSTVTFNLAYMIISATV